VLDDGAVGPGVRADRIVWVNYRTGLTAWDVGRAMAVLQPRPAAASA
jgi:hypothetical protein